MNCAFFIDNFKGTPGRTYIINGNIDSLKWLSEKLGQMISLTENKNIKIGDGNPFESNIGTLDIIIDSEIDEPEFKSSGNQSYLLSMNRDDITEIADKIDGIVKFGKASHNYFDISSGELNQLFITTGEYTDALLAKMAQDEDRNYGDSALNSHI
jgi:hypothetical protein